MNTQHYLLPVVAVVETMQELSDVVMLQAQLASLPGLAKEPCLAQIILGQGHVHSCTITATRTGAVLLKQQDALLALERCGDVHWSVLPAPSFSEQTRQMAALPPMNVSRAFPSPVPSLRVRELTPEILASLSHSYRRVLLLVDGKRSLEEIARLAAKPPQEVVHMLKTLEHLIAF